VFPVLSDCLVRGEVLHGRVVVLPATMRMRAPGSAAPQIAERAKGRR
jgi:hypothetical protein